MGRVLSIYLLFLAVLSLPLPATAQNEKIPVSVTHSGDDAIGRRFAYAVREEIRSSNGYRYESGPQAFLRVSLVTMDPDSVPGNAGSWSVATIVLTMRNLNQFEEKNPQTWYAIYLTSSLYTIGQSRVESQAKSVMAMIDQAVEAFRKDLR